MLYNYICIDKTEGPLVLSENGIKVYFAINGQKK